MIDRIDGLNVTLAWEGLTQDDRMQFLLLNGDDVVYGKEILSQSGKNTITVEVAPNTAYRAKLTAGSQEATVGVLVPDVIPIPIATSTPTVADSICVGDCNGDGDVPINEVVAAVNAFLKDDISICANADLDSDGTVSINEVVAAVKSYLDGPQSCAVLMR